jgi:DNA polymerase phi
MPGKRFRDKDAGEYAEDLVERKKIRTFTDQDGKLANLYENLADEASDVRLNAAKDLVAELLSESVLDHKHLEKAIKRLIRGLCSGRKAARLGFFLAFTELLRQLYSSKSNESPISKTELIPLIKSLTRAEGQASGQVRCSVTCHLLKLTDYRKKEIIALGDFMRVNV